MHTRDVGESLHGRVAGKPLPPPPIAVLLPEVDEADEQGEALGYAEGQSFMIEYVDSAGRPSARRITVFGIVQGRAGVPLLNAHCHERKKMRQFRVDRIRCCIDYDGEVHADVPAFLTENFGMSLAMATLKAADDTHARWQDVLDLVRDEAVLLAAMSHCDGVLHCGEVEAAVRYLARTGERDGTILEDADIARLEGFFMRLRPTRQSIDRVLANLVRHDADRVRRLLHATIDVLDADGLRHPSEMDLLDAICLELTGTGIF